MNEWAITEKPYSEQTYEREMEFHKSIFINDFRKKKLAELGPEKFEKQEQKLTKEAEARWSRIRKARSKILDLEEKMHTELMKWSQLEKLYRDWLEAAAHPQRVIENTIEARLRDFQTAQTVLRERLKTAAYNADEDFKRRMLNPETRQQAIQYFLSDNVEKPHFLIKTIELLFSELDKLKR